jgi:hypothetical protein
VFDKVWWVICSRCGDPTDFTAKRPDNLRKPRRSSNRDQQK